MYTNKPSIPELPCHSIWGSGVHVHQVALQTQAGTTGLHKAGETGSEYIATAGDSDSVLPRRLAFCNRLLLSLHSGHSSSSQSYYSAGMQD